MAIDLYCPKCGREWNSAAGMLCPACKDGGAVRPVKRGGPTMEGAITGTVDKTITGYASAAPPHDSISRPPDCVEPLGGSGADAAPAGADRTAGELIIDNKALRQALSKIAHGNPLLHENMGDFAGYLQSVARSAFMDEVNRNEYFTPYLLNEIYYELHLSREKQPDVRMMTAALNAQCGKVARAVMSEPRAAVQSAAISLIVLAMRLFEEGDATADIYRAHMELDPTVPPAAPQAAPPAMQEEIDASDLCAELTGGGENTGDPPVPLGSRP